MIESKRTFNAYFYLSMFLFFLLSLICMIFIFYCKRDFNDRLLFLTLINLFMTLFFGQYVRKGFKTIKTSQLLKTINFKNPIFFLDKTLNFNKIQGYVTGRAKRGGPSGKLSFEIIWLIINNKMTNRIDGEFIKNINEIENDLKELPYLGYQIITFKKRLKMLFFNIKI